MDNVKDPGGATNKGITRRTLAQWRDVPIRDLPKTEVMNISDEETAAIYKEKYWRSARCSDLPIGLDHAVFDFAVNSGPSRAAKELQKIIGTKADGIIGGMTLRAIARKGNNLPGLIDEYLDNRLTFMQGLKHRKTRERLWDEFGRGWSIRVERVREESKNFIRTS